jgi:hypothetical protein
METLHFSENHSRADDGGLPPTTEMEDVWEYGMR